MAGEDLFGYGQSAGGGSTGSSVVDPNNPANHNTYNDFAFGGDAGTPARFDENGNMLSPGSPSYAKSTQEGYHQMGQQMADRPAYQADYSDYEYGKQHGANALQMQSNAAHGYAPSQAEQLGGRMLDQSMAAQQSAAASSRGGVMAQAEASRRAGNAATQVRAGGLRDIAAMRANEMAQARGQYMQGSLGFGTMGLGKSAQDLQNEQYQRQLNQQGQQWAEGMRFNTAQAGMDSNFRRRGMEIGATDSARGYDLAKHQSDMSDVYGAINAGSGVGSTISQWKNPSDSRTKIPAQLGAQPGATKGGAPGWLRQAQAEYNAKQPSMREDPYGDPQLADMLDERHKQNLRGMGRDVDGGPPAMSGDITRSDPYGSFQHEDPYGPPSRKGYAASRAGQEGFMFGPSPSTNPEGALDKTSKLGGADLGGLSPYRYGDRPAIDQGGGFAPGTTDDLMSGGTGGFSYSDDRTKLAEAYATGRAYEAAERDRAADKVNGPMQFMHPDYVDNDTPAGTAPEPPAHIKRGVMFARHPELFNADKYPELFEPKPVMHGKKDPSGLSTPRTAPVAAARVPAIEEAPLAFGGGMRPPMASSDERTKTKGGQRPGAMEEDAARRMTSQPYSYKDEYRPQEQGPGEVNYGPMAQELEKNPLTATAVKKDQNGMRMVDMTKMVKAQSGVISHLQRQIDEMKGGGRGQ